MEQGAGANHDFDRLVAVGRVAKTQGRHGEVAVDPLTDDLDRFSALERVFVAGSDGEAVALGVESARIHKGRPVLKLSGVTGIAEAKHLCGKEIRIPEDEVVRLPEGSFHHFEIVGLSVVDRRGGDLGVVERILETGGTDVLVVRNAEGEETLVPLCQEIVTKVDRAGGRIEIEAPEGLVSLNAD
jgi:16S rRNA processing protein RimM